MPKSKGRGKKHGAYIILRINVDTFLPGTTDKKKGNKTIKETSRLLKMC